MQELRWNIHSEEMGNHQIMNLVIVVWDQAIKGRIVRKTIAVVSMIVEAAITSIRTSNVDLIHLNV